mgnify:CR=1 FL=1
MEACRKQLRAFALAGTANMPGTELAPRRIIAPQPIETGGDIRRRRNRERAQLRIIGARVITAEHRLLPCLFYTSDPADGPLSVLLGGRRNIKKKKKITIT